MDKTSFIDTACNQHNIIWVNVLNGVGKHGDFLKSFAQAFTRADSDNKLILLIASTTLILKYHLSEPQYLVQDGRVQ
jgi:hypothetical protein